MSDPRAYTPAPVPQMVPLTVFDRVRPVIAPLVGFVVSLACGAFVARYGERFRFTEVPIEAQVAIASAVLSAVQYLVAELTKLAVAAKVNPSSSASPTFAKAAKASPIGSASEGAANLTALAMTGERQTAGAAIDADMRTRYAAMTPSRGPGAPSSGPHGVADAGTHAEDGTEL